MKPSIPSLKMNLSFHFMWPRIANIKLFWSTDANHRYLIWNSKIKVITQGKVRVEMFIININNNGNKDSNNNNRIFNKVNNDNKVTLWLKFQKQLPQLEEVSIWKSKLYLIPNQLKGITVEAPEEFRLIAEETVRLFKLDIIEESVSDYLSIPFLQKTKMTRPICHRLRSSE
ncbi:hypothetical protein ACTA71_000186 [Dictyostelium dimigraforme]